VALKDLKEVLKRLVERKVITFHIGVDS